MRPPYWYQQDGENSIDMLMLMIFLILLHQQSKERGEQNQRCYGMCNEHDTCQLFSSNRLQCTDKKMKHVTW